MLAGFHHATPANRLPFKVTRRRSLSSAAIVRFTTALVAREQSEKVRRVLLVSFLAVHCALCALSVFQLAFSKRKTSERGEIRGSPLGVRLLLYEGPVDNEGVLPLPPPLLLLHCRCDLPASGQRAPKPTHFVGKTATTKKFIIINFGKWVKTQSKKRILC